jgi:hypothetical protein
MSSRFGSSRETYFVLDNASQVRTRFAKTSEDWTSLQLQYELTWFTFENARNHVNGRTWAGCKAFSLT